MCIGTNILDSAKLGFFQINLFEHLDTGWGLFIQKEMAVEFQDFDWNLIWNENSKIMDEMRVSSLVPTMACLIRFYSPDLDHFKVSILTWR